MDEDIHGPYNADEESAFIELVLVVDNEIYKKFNKNLTKVHRHCKDVINVVNAVSVLLSNRSKSIS